MNDRSSKNQSIWQSGVWRTLGFAALLLMATPAVSAQSLPGCGSLDNAYGPWDYSNPVHRAERLRVVEESHYDAGVQGLTGNRNQRANSLASDIDYVLRAFPNHHKALYTLVKYDLSENPKHRERLPHSTECYFQRAAVWQPRDGKVKLIHGIWKARKGDFATAKQLFNEAERLTPDSAELHYNIGLVLAKNGEYPKAREHAHKAYALGYPMPGLRNILTRAGQWEADSP